MNTDLQLVRRYLQGDLSAFDRLFEMHGGQVYSFAFHITGKQVEADDLCQDIWLEAIRSLPTFQGRAPFRAWMHGIAVNVYRHRQRKRSVASVPLDEQAHARHSSPNANAASAAADARLLVREALSRLPDEQREVVILHELQGFSHAEIARMLGCPDGTIRSRLHHAIAALRRMLGADEARGR